MVLASAVGPAAVEGVGNGTSGRSEKNEKNEKECRHRHLMATTVVGTTARNQLLL